MNPARLKAYLMLLGVAIIWGIASPVIKYTLDYFDPALFLTYRYFIATVFAILSFIYTKHLLPKGFYVIFLLIVYSFLNSVVGLGMLFFGMENTTVLDMSLITLIGPLIVSTAGVYYLGERITKREKIGMFIAFLGTLLTIVEPIFLNGNNIVKFSGNLLVLGYVANTAITSVLAKKLLRLNVSPLMLVNWSFIVGFICFGIYTYLNNQISISYIMNASSNYHLGVIYMALISGTVAFWLSAKAQKTIEISEQSVFSYLSPIFSLPIAVIWLGEKITPLFIVGAIIITIGVLLAEIKTNSRV